MEKEKVVLAFLLVNTGINLGFIKETKDPANINRDSIELDKKN